MEKKRLGIKASLDPDEFNHKLKIKVGLLEIFLRTTDMNDELPGRIQSLLKSYPGIQLTLHTPIRIPEGLVNLEDDDGVEVYSALCDICEEEKRVIGIIMHAGDDRKKIIAEAKRLLKKKPRCADFIHVENCHGALYELESFRSLVKEMGMKKVCFDISHFASCHNEAQLLAALKTLGNEFELYSHISDNFYDAGNPFPKNIGQGVVDLKRVLELIPIGIVETYSKDESVGKEMLDDYQKLLTLL
jgi:uncharacterized metal-binding protein